MLEHFTDVDHALNLEDVKIFGKEIQYFRRSSLEALHICNEKKNAYNFRIGIHNILSTKKLFYHFWLMWHFKPSGPQKIQDENTNTFVRGILIKHSSKSF